MDAFDAIARAADMTTPSDMTDAELVEAVARGPMGWDFMEAHPASMQPSQWVRQDGTSFPCVDWSPTTDANHRDEVVERMRRDKKLWDRFVEEYVNLCCEPFETLIENAVGSALLNMSGRSVCEAALEACRSKASLPVTHTKS